MVVIKEMRIKYEKKVGIIACIIICFLSVITAGGMYSISKEKSALEDEMNKKTPIEQAIEKLEYQSEIYDVVDYIHMYIDMLYIYKDPNLTQAEIVFTDKIWQDLDSRMEKFNSDQKAILENWVKDMRKVKISDGYAENSMSLFRGNGENLLKQLGTSIGKEKACEYTRGGSLSQLSKLKIFIGDESAKEIERIYSKTLGTN